MAGTKHLGAPKLFGESRLDERPTDAETRVDAGDVKRLTDRLANLPRLVDTSGVARSAGTVVTWPLPAALISAAGTLQPPTL